MAGTKRKATPAQINDGKKVKLDSHAALKNKTPGKPQRQQHAVSKSSSSDSSSDSSDSDSEGGVGLSTLDDGDSTEQGNGLHPERAKAVIANSELS